MKVGSFPNQIPRDDVWYRYPLGFITEIINSDEYKISSPAGGIIYFMAGPQSRDVSFEISNVAEAAVFNKGKSGWNEKAPAPLAQVVADNFIMTIPKKHLKGINETELADAVDLWDRIFFENANITGFSLGFKEPLIVDIQAVSGK